MPEQDEMKYCRSCKRDRALDEFEEGYLSYIQCVGYKRKYNEKHKEKWMKHKEKYMKKMNNTESIYWTWGAKEVKQKVSCSVCHCSISQAHYYRH